LLRHRAALVWLSTSGKNRVHAVLADRGIQDHSGLWTAPGRAWLADLQLPATPRGIIEDCCGLVDALATPIGRLEREIATLAKPDPRVQTLLARSFHILTQLETAPTHRRRLVPGALAFPHAPPNTAACAD
jgi:hypothetical protein